MSERVNIYSGPTAPEGIQLANPGDLFIQVVEGSPDVGNLFYKGQGELGTGWVELQLGGGSAGVGGTNGQLQFNNDGSFDGAKFSSVDPSSGVITWDDGSGDISTFNPNNNSYGPSFMFQNTGTGMLAEIAAQGIYLESGAKITQFGSSSTDVNQFSFQTEFNVPDPVVSQYAAVVINATSSMSNPLDGIRSAATFTDNSAVGSFARGGIFQAELAGSNVEGDSAYGLAAYVINDGYPGNPAELSGLVVLSLSNFGSSAVTQTGVHIQDQGQNSQASGINAALLIDNQTAGATVFSIYTGTGPNSFGDVASITPPNTSTSALTVTCSGSTEQVAITATGASDGAAFVGYGTGGDYAVIQIQATGNSGESSTAGNFSAAATDDSGSGVNAFCLQFQATLEGANATGKAIGLCLSAAAVGSSGTPAEASGILIYSPSILPTSIPTITSGIHIQDTNFSGNPALTANAAILIDSQTPGANVYSILTGVGDIFFNNSGSNFGIFGATPEPQQTVTGAKSDAVAASILSALVAYGLVLDGTT